MPRACNRSAAARSAAGRSTAAVGGTTRRAVERVIGSPFFSPTQIGFIFSRSQYLRGDSHEPVIIGSMGGMDRAAVAAIAALDDDVRRALYEHVRAAGAPVTREEAAAAVG